MFGFGRKKGNESPSSHGVSTHGASDTSSISDATSSSSQRSSGIFGFGRRSSISEGSSSSGKGVDIDNGLANLYGDCDLLEIRCRGAASSQYEMPTQPKRGSTASEYDADGLEQIQGMRKTAEDVLESLSEGYFDESFDPVDMQVQAFQSWEPSEYNEKFMALIEEADTDKDVLTVRLAVTIQENMTDLTRCIGDVFAVEQELDIATKTVVDTRCRLRDSDSVLAEASINVNTLHQRKERLSSVRGLLKNLRDLKSMAESVETHAQKSDSQTAAESAYEVLRSVRSATYERFDAAKSLGISVMTRLPPLRRQLDAQLAVLLGGQSGKTTSTSSSAGKGHSSPPAIFAVGEYSKLVRTYLLLDHIRDVTGAPLYGPGDEEELERCGNGSGAFLDGMGNMISPLGVEGDTSECMAGHIGRVVAVLMDRIARAPRIAATEFVRMSKESPRGVGGRRASGVAPKKLAADTVLQGSDMMDEEDWAELYEHVSSELRVDCVVRTAELFCDVVHTHYLLSQWHAEPMDERAEDDDPTVVASFLHRCAIDTEAELHDAASLGFGAELFTAGRDRSEWSDDELSVGMCEGEEEEEGVSDSGSPVEDVPPTPHDKEGGCRATEGGGDEDAATCDGQGHVSPTKAADGCEATTAAAGDVREEEESDRENTPSSDGELDIEDAVQAALQSGIRKGGGHDDESDGCAGAEGENAVTAPPGPPTVDTSSPMPGSLTTPRRRSSRRGSSSSVNTGSKSSQRRSLRVRERALLIRDGIMAEVQLQQQQKGQEKENDDDAAMREAAQRGRLKVSHLQLCASRQDVWHAIELASVQMVRSVDFGASVPLDDFLTLMWALHILIRLGEEFCGASSVLLASCLRDKALAYFDRQHLESFQTLRHMIEAEAWHAVPMSAEDCGSEGVIGLVKSSLLKSSPGDASRRGRLRLAGTGWCNEAEGGGILLGFHTHGGNPLSAIDPMAVDRSDDVTLATPLLPGVFESEEPGQKEHGLEGMTVTQTCLNGLVRYTGQYLQMMQLLGPHGAAPRVFEGLCQLFDFYLSCVHAIFVHQQEQRVWGTDPPLRSSAPAPECWREFQALTLYLTSVLQNTAPSISGGEATVSTLLISECMTPLNALDDACGLVSRVAAAESCCFAASVLRAVRSKAEALLPNTHTHTCTSFVSIFDQISGQLRTLVLRSACQQLMDAEQLTSRISECSWESRTPAEDSNAWVAAVIQRCATALALVAEREVAAPALQMLWLELTRAIYEGILDGFTRVKKVSNEGRASMKLDLGCVHHGLKGLQKQYIVVLEGLESPRGVVLVEDFLRASFLEDAEMMQWVSSRYHEYSYRHLQGLLNQTTKSMLSQKRLKEKLTELDALYAQDQQFGEETARRRSMFKTSS